MTVSLTKTPLTVSPTDHAAVVYARAKNRAALIADLNAEQAADLAVLACLPPQTGKVEVEGLGSFTVSENNTYDETTMREALSPGQVRRCSVAKFDKGAAKRLYPDVYLASKRALGRKVTLG